MGRMQRRKGANWERELANMLKPIFGEKVCRGVAQSRFGSSEAPDVDNVPGYWFECKHGIKPNLRAALEQAEESETKFRESMSANGYTCTSRVPVAVSKDNNQEPIVLMRLKDFIPMLKELHAYRSTPKLVQTEKAVDELQLIEDDEKIPKEIKK